MSNAKNINKLVKDVAKESASTLFYATGVKETEIKAREMLYDFLFRLSDVVESGGVVLVPMVDKRDYPQDATYNL